MAYAIVCVLFWQNPLRPFMDSFAQLVLEAAEITALRLPHGILEAGTKTPFQHELVLLLRRQFPEHYFVVEQEYPISNVYVASDGRFGVVSSYANGCRKHCVFITDRCM